MEKDQTQKLISGFVHSEKSPLTSDKLKQFKGLEHLSNEEAETVLHSLKRLASILVNLQMSNAEPNNENLKQAA